MKLLSASKSHLVTALLSLFILLCVSVKSQSGCGVTASFYPGVDTFFTSSQSITFINTSTNAESIEWRVNHFYADVTESFTRNFDPGVHKVSLVARKGTCTDTFSILVVCTGNPPTDKNFYHGTLGIDGFINNGISIAPAADSGVLIAALTTFRATSFQILNSLLIKVKKQNCIEWTKMITQPNSNIRIHETIGLKDGGFLISGDASYVPFIMRINSSGELQWIKHYSDTPGSGRVGKLYEMKDGSIIALLFEITSGISILKLDAAGNMLWNRFLLLSSAPSAHVQGKALVEMNGALYVTGVFQENLNSPFNIGNFLPFISKLNPATGEEQWTNFYRNATNRSTTFQTLQQVGDSLFIIGSDYFTSGLQYPENYLLWMDTSGTVRSSVGFKSIRPVIYSFPAIGGVLPSGNIFMNFRHSERTPFGNDVYFTNYILLDPSMNLLREDRIRLQENANLEARFTGNGFVSTGSLYGSSVLPWMATPENIHFLKIDINALAGNNCISNVPTLNRVTAGFQKQKLTLILDTTLIFNNLPPPALMLVDAYTAMRSTCPAYVDSCSILLVKGPSSVCNINKTYTYKAGKNGKCPQAVEWSYSGNLSVLSRTDSSITVRFNQQGDYIIKSVLKNSCSPVVDSMFVKVTTPSFTLNLGPDRELCTGNSLLLKAPSYFSSYLWQNGSTDSSLNVTVPGLYWLEARDNCSNVWRDTVYVRPSAGFTISTGPDRMKCNNDTIHLSAPTGYRSYKWRAAHDPLFSDTSRNIIVNPLQSTQYFLAAEQNAGCFGFDTITVTVHQSPLIHLGSDTSICSNDSLLLTAPPGFTTYAWSNGSTANAIYASLPGTYFLNAITSNGCRSTDTMRILSNYLKPVVKITGNDVICKGSSTELDAGSFTGARYLWNTGSSSRFISVTSTGNYAVTITDINGCSSTGYFNIARIVNPPKYFLPDDTTICNYSHLTLQSKSNFKSYLWNTNSSSKSISVTSPGLYTLIVTDYDNCKGADSIRVDVVECLSGFFVPTAFSPNRDGLNDVFKPLLFGDITFYDFTVYNRWGEPVYRSTEPAKGWDGTYKGFLQPPGTYIWRCGYRFANGSTEVKSGTVVLIF